MAAANVGFSLNAATAWQLQSAQASRRAATQRFLDGAALASQVFSNAQTNQVNGMVKLSAAAVLGHPNALSMSSLTLVNLIAAANQSLALPSGANTILDISA
jgi:hypothetical protein